jgi:hypothetical protein
MQVQYSKNQEIGAEWLLVSAKKGYDDALKATEDFLLSVGRRKFIVPIYKELMKTHPDLAKTIYKRARPNYHPVTTGSLDEIVV